MLSADPSRGDLALRLCSVLIAQGKPVPAEIEEQALREMLSADPSRGDLALRLCSVLIAQGKPVPAEIEERALISVLRKDPERADIAVTLACLIAQRGGAVDDIRCVTNWCLDSDPHTRSLEPFVFLHIPKTAGSIVRLLVLSLFDQSHVFPGWNFDDYETSDRNFESKIDTERHGVFVGHMYWDAVSTIERVLGKKPHVLAILREPLSRLRSLAAFDNRIKMQTAAHSDASSIQAKSEIILEDYVGLANDDWPALSCDSDPQFDLSDTPTSPDILSGPTSFQSVANKKMDDVIIGFFENLRESLDLFCSKLQLPFLEIPQIWLNESGADHSTPLGNEQNKRLREALSLSLSFDALARSRFHQIYRDTFVGIADIPSHLNQLYRDAVLARMQPYWCVRLEAGRSWPGYGWGFRQTNEHGQTWRRLEAGDAGVVLAKLNRNCDYVVSLSLHSCDSDATLARIVACVGGARLASEDRAFIDGHFVLNWKLPASRLNDPAGSIVLTFTIDGGGSVSGAYLEAREISVTPFAVCA
jgi:hypothetical protein